MITQVRIGMSTYYMTGNLISLYSIPELYKIRCPNNRIYDDSHESSTEESGKQKRVKGGG